MISGGISVDGVPIVRMESDLLRIDVAPSLGGKIVSVLNKRADCQFLWRDPLLKLRQIPAGGEYDPNFCGGIDELLPNDLSESIDGVPCPDHGELWTHPLHWRVEGEGLHLSGRLPLTGLSYHRRMTLDSHCPTVHSDYEVQNHAPERRNFLWRLHAAVNIQPGDRISCDARFAQAADPAWSKRPMQPFEWPMAAGQDASQVPVANGTTDFLFLSKLRHGWMAWRNATRGLVFGFKFDTRVFPYAAYFASYGGFRGQYFAILEPCTAMPLLVSEAAGLKQCSCLQPGETLRTTVILYAGHDDGNVVGVMNAQPRPFHPANSI